MKDYYEKELYVHAPDIAGYRKVNFIFEDGSAYCIDYSWWVDYEEEGPIFNEFEIVKIEPDSFEYPADKDWLII